MNKQATNCHQNCHWYRELCDITFFKQNPALLGGAEMENKHTKVN